MWVEQEWSDTKGENRYPKVDQVRRPEREGDIEEHQQRAHAEVDARTGEAREKDAERDPGRRKATAGSDVSRATEGQVVQDRVGVDLGGEHLKHRRERHELLAESRERSTSTTLNQFWVTQLELENRTASRDLTLHEQRQKRDHEYQEDTDNAMVDPVEDRVEIVAASLSVQRLAGARVLANCEFRVKSAEEDHCGKKGCISSLLGKEKIRTSHDEELYRQDDEHVVNVETGVTVVERQETVDGELRAEVVVLATEHLFTHAGADFGLEVEDRAKTEVAPLAALVVLGVFNAPTTSERVHTGVDVLV